MSVSFRRIVIALVGFGLLGGLVASDYDSLPPVTIVAASDLRADAGAAREQQLPILLYFGSDYCSYCRYVEEDQIKPMLRNRSYDSKVLVRRVNVSSLGYITHINGKRMSANELASLYRAAMTPTLIFINSNGDEIAPRLVGVASPDYYGGDLDSSIDTALQTLRRVAAR